MPWPFAPKEEMKVSTPDDGVGGMLSFDDTDYGVTTLDVLIKAYDDALHELEIMNVPARSRDVLLQLVHVKAELLGDLQGGGLVHLPLGAEHGLVELPVGLARGEGRGREVAGARQEVGRHRHARLSASHPA